MPEPAIGDYGLIGDGRTVALCSSHGSIDWLCVPRFDSEPVFGRLVGGERAGSFSIRVDGVRETVRRYRDRSAVLETTWRTGSSEVRLTEGMVLDVSSSLIPQLVLVRRVETRGAPTIARIRFDPRRGLPGDEPRTERRSNLLACSWGSLVLGLLVEPGLPLVPSEEIDVLLDPATPLTFVLTLADREPIIHIGSETAKLALEATDDWWREWCRGVRHQGLRDREVLRSLITLRLLTYAPSGAPVAAATTSLPEAIGGSSNWDYRFSWPRDASIGLSAFLPLGKLEEARSFIHWLLHASRLTRPRLHVLYTLDGNPGPREQEIPEAAGYRGSRPVRVGNSASHQHQLDVYGWVLDAAWGMVRSGLRLHAETWRGMSSLADFVAENWRRPDASMWEVRGEERHYVHSKLMGWLALDRAVRIAGTHRTRRRRVQRWQTERDTLGADVRARGFDPQRGSYVRSYGAADLDAALLLLPALGFEEPGSPRLGGTVSAIRAELATGPFVYRYPLRESGAGTEGAFLACSFWLVDALARLGRVAEAEEVFESLLAHANDLGLFAEEIDPATGEHLGNFPQGLTHAALIQAALSL
ncbi:MAG: glycoside hydrolase family 15 protein, partial [Actinomycetota bacterium]